MLQTARRLPILAAAAIAFNANATQPLQLTVYNPGEQSLFAVSSVIVSGEHEAVLIDAQFQRNDAEALVEKIRASGKTLTTIYISHSDPDFYFGLDVIQAAFPQARIIATPQTIAAIDASKAAKLAYWGPILQANAPQSLVEPQPLQGATFTVDGQTLEVKGLTGPTPDRTFVWVPALKAVVGGVAVSGNSHLWVADTQTPESRTHWLQTLAQIDALQPQVVVPGHFLPGAPLTLASVHFTQRYLTTLNTELGKTHDAAELIAAMKQHYPQLKEESSLEMSAKVLKGELQWP